MASRAYKIVNSVFSGSFIMKMYHAGIGCFVAIALLFIGCEKPKPTIGEQIGNTIDTTIQTATENGAAIKKNVKDAANQTKKNSEALRGEVKDAVDDQFKQLEGDSK